MKGFTAAIAVLAIGFSGCSTPYKPVEGNNLATIRVVNKSGGVILPMESQKGDCRDMQWFGDYLARTGEHVPAGQSVSTKTRPGGLFVMNISGDVSFMPIGACHITAGLLPEPDGVYEITYRVVASDRCEVDAERVDSGIPVSVPLLPVVLHNAIGPQWCELRKRKN